MNAAVLSALTQSIVKGLTERTLEPKPVAILQQGMSFLSQSKELSGQEKKQLLVTAIKMIARGPDGIPGTADDVIPHFVTVGLTALIESEMLEDVIELAHGAFKRAHWMPKCLKCTE
jgi:hypothetical protein